MLERAQKKEQIEEKNRKLFRLKCRINSIYDTLVSKEGKIMRNELAIEKPFCHLCMKAKREKKCMGNKKPNMRYVFVCRK
jgi:hypothetical protein